MKTTLRKHFLINKESKEKLPKDLLKILASKDAWGLHKYLESRKIIVLTEEISTTDTFIYIFEGDHNFPIICEKSWTDGTANLVIMMENKVMYTQPLLNFIEERVEEIREGNDLNMWSELIPDLMMDFNCISYISEEMDFIIFLLEKSKEEKFEYICSWATDEEDIPEEDVEEVVNGLVN